MDQLVKEKLDGDKQHREEVLDLKEHIAQLETKLHVDKTKGDLEVRQHGDRLDKFCQWTADQAVGVVVQTTLGQFKRGTLSALDPASGTASVVYEDGTSESEVILRRVSIAPKQWAPAGFGGAGGAATIHSASSPADVLHASQQQQAPATPGAAPAAVAQQGGGGDLVGMLSSMSQQEKTLMVFLPLVVFPAVVVLLAVVLSFVYSAE